MLDMNLIVLLLLSVVFDGGSSVGGVTEQQILLKKWMINGYEHNKIIMAIKTIIQPNGVHDIFTNQRWSRIC